MKKHRAPVLAAIRFAERRNEFAGLDLAARFDLIHRTNLWGAASSVSGLGSELAATAKLRGELSGLLHRLGVRTLLDLPCGDFTWMAGVDLDGVSYLGGDIVAAIVETNARRYGISGRVDFSRIDLVEDSIPKSDLVLCRDCLVHLSYRQIALAIDNIKRSGSRWLLTTTFVNLDRNRDIEDGDWRALNLQAPPFLFPKPVEILTEDCAEAGGDYADKALALWPVDRLPDL